MSLLDRYKAPFRGRLNDRLHSRIQTMHAVPLFFCIDLQSGPGQL